MTVDATLNFDALTEGSSLSPSAPWSILGVAPVVSAASAKNGAKGIGWASTGTAGRVQYDYSSNQTARPVVAAMNFRIPTMSTANLYLGNIMSLASGGASQADWRVNPTGTVSIRNATTAVATSTTALLSNTWYHAEWKVDDTANTQALRIFADGTTSPMFELTGAYSSVLTRVATFGPSVAAAGGSVDLDDLTVANDWIVTAPPPPAPAITATLLDFDSQADAAAYSPVAPWSTVGVVPTIKTAAAKHGARGIQWASTATAGRVQYDFGSALSVALFMSSYFRITTLATVNLYLGNVSSAATAGTVQADWRVNPTTSTVSLRNSTTAVGTSSAALSVNTWYRSEWKVDPATSTQELRIYLGEATTTLLTLTGAYGGAANTRVPSFGPNTAAAGGAVDMDTLRLAADWPGAFDVGAAHRVWHRKRSDGTHTGLIAHRKIATAADWANGNSWSNANPWTS